MEASNDVLISRNGHVFCVALQMDQASEEYMGSQADLVSFLMRRTGCVSHVLHAFKAMLLRYAEAEAVVAVLEQMASLGSKQRYFWSLFGFKV
jgi:hypothetical protein